MLKIPGLIFVSSMITEAAIFKDGKFYTGKRHSDIFRNNKGINLKGGIQGFLTDDHVFLNRKEAALHALECKQITELMWPPDLYSEELIKL